MRLAVTVTQDDIDGGRTSDQHRCAFNLALNRSARGAGLCGFSTCHPDSLSFIARDGDGREERHFSSEVPKEVEAFIELFDVHRGIRKNIRYTPKALREIRRIRRTGPPRPFSTVLDFPTLQPAPTRAGGRGSADDPARRMDLTWG